MLTSLNRLTGMPVIWQDKTVGVVERGVPDPGARRLQGLVIRKGFQRARWVPAEKVKLLGRQCVLIGAKPENLPEEAGWKLGEAYLTTGERAGQVCDALLGGASLRLVALEISPGPLYALLGRSAYADRYRMTRQGEHGGQAMVAGLFTWAEMKERLGKEAWE